MNKIKSLITGTIMLLASLTAAYAGGTEINVTLTGLALRGVDPVSYFNGGAPAAGDFKITAVHDGAVYRFVSDDNKKAFEAAPEKYLPQFGGYCAMGVKMGKKLDGDPALWTVVDGKLYLNVAKPIADMWRKDTTANIAAANAKWPEIKVKDPAGL